MKICTLITPSHEVLFREHFLPSFLATQAPSTGLVVARAPQSGSGEYESPGFKQTMLAKLELLQDMAENSIEPIMYVDADVQFFGDLRGAIVDALARRSIVFQHDGLDGDRGEIACAGMVAFTPCLATRIFISSWAQEVEFSEVENDQPALNTLLRREPTNWWGLLNPNEFFGGGTHGNPGLWRPGMPIAVPAAPLVHHANYTIGVPNKIAQLNAVRETLAVRRQGRAA